MRKYFSGTNIEKVWLSILPGLIAVGIRLAIGPYIVDDAYISFRYAANLADGIGLVYNPGERVFGSSTPVYVFALFFFHKVAGVDFPFAALWINALSDGVSAILLVRLAGRLRLCSTLALLCGLVWAVYPISIRYAVGGMETSLATLLVLLSFTLFLQRHDFWAVFFAAFAVLTRLDALAYAAVLLFGIGWGNLRKFVRVMLLFGMMLAPWYLFSYFYFGSLIPHSIVAKSQGVYSFNPFVNVIQFVYFFGGLIAAGPLRMFAKGLYFYPEQFWHLIVLVVFAEIVILLWIRGVQSEHIEKRWLAATAFMVSFCLAYILLGFGGGAMAEWYLVQVSPFLVIGVFAGFQAILARSRWRETGSVTAGCLLLALQFTGFAHSAWREKVLMPDAVWVEREVLYEEAVGFLKPEITSADLVAASEIGTIGYFCGCRILDTVGLVSPQALAYYPLPSESLETNNAVSPDLMREWRPDYLITLDVFIRKSLMPDTWFNQNYHLIWEKQTSIFGSQFLQIYAYQGEDR